MNKTMNEETTADDIAEQIEAGLSLTICERFLLQMYVIVQVCTFDDTKQRNSMTILPW